MRCTVRFCRGGKKTPVTSDVSQAAKALFMDLGIFVSKQAEDRKVYKHESIR